MIKSRYTSDDLTSIKKKYSNLIYQDIDEHLIPNIKIISIIEEILMFLLPLIVGFMLICEIRKSDFGIEERVVYYLLLGIFLYICLAIICFAFNYKKLYISDFIIKNFFKKNPEIKEFIDNENVEKLLLYLGNYISVLKLAETIEQDTKDNNLINIYKSDNIIKYNASKDQIKDGYNYHDSKEKTFYIYPETMNIIETENGFDFSLLNDNIENLLSEINKNINYRETVLNQKIKE